MDMAAAVPIFMGKSRDSQGCLFSFTKTNSKEVVVVGK